MPARRLRVVVVLPTPPFWLKTAMTAMRPSVQAGRARAQKCDNSHLYECGLAGCDPRGGRRQAHALRTAQGLAPARRQAVARARARDCSAIGAQCDLCGL